MKTFFFTKGGKNTASSRQRAFLVAEHLSQMGMEVEVVTPSCEDVLSEKGFLKKIPLLLVLWRSLSRIKKDDVIFLQRTIYGKHFFLLLVVRLIFFRGRVIFDLDDAIFLHSKLKTLILIKLSSVVIVGSQYLKDWTESYHQNVFLVPTSVEHTIYFKFSHLRDRTQAPIVLGWVGNGPAHMNNLRILVPVFEALIERNLNFKFKLVGGLGSEKVDALFTGIRGLDYEIIDSLEWTDETAVPKMIQTFDIGLMPLVEDEWSKGKCSFKAIEYMACGVVPVVSAVGENRILVNSGENGYLATSTEDWVNATEGLFDNRELFDRLSETAQKTIKNGYSFLVNIPRISNIIKYGKD